jgi:DnaJ-class molecular chaperone
MSKVRNCPYCYGTGKIGMIGRCTYCHGRKKVLSDYVKWYSNKAYAVAKFERTRKEEAAKLIDKDIKKWEEKHPKPRKFPKNTK